MEQASNLDGEVSPIRRNTRIVILLMVTSSICWWMWNASSDGMAKGIFSPHANSRPTQTKQSSLIEVREDLKTTNSENLLRQLDMEKHEKKIVMVKSPGMKYILLWNEFFGYPNWGLGTVLGSEIFEKLECPVKECFMTDDKSLQPAEEYDAVVVHTYHFKMGARNKGEFPLKRHSNQRYIFFILESPIHCGSDYKNMENSFNWTMTYRLDSDFVFPYGIVVPREEVKVPSIGWLEHPSPPISPSAAAALIRNETVKGGGNIKSTRMGPTGRPMVAWMVSHCSTQSRREKYVSQMSKYIQVDVYGGCGTPLPKRNDSFALLRHPKENERYMFYLSFENSLCRDYVTEKFFQILDLPLIPVVYGAANYNAVAPPYSYIDATRFESPRHLAEYLHFLARRPSEYRKFFWWKRFYKVEQNPKSSLCNLCANLHEPLPPKIYENIQDWWNRDGTCIEPKV